MCITARENLSKPTREQSSLSSNRWSMPPTSRGRTLLCKSGRPPQEAWTFHRGELATRTHSIDMLDFWQTNNRGKSYGLFAGYRTPPGTLWADELRLDECIVSYDLEALTAEAIFHARLRP